MNSHGTLSDVSKQQFDKTLKEQLAAVRLLALDVDGVLTDGTFVYDSAGTEHKRFHVADGLGLVLLRLQGIAVAWISGRASSLVERRARELGVSLLLQGTRDKAQALTQLCADLNIAREMVAYMGDDWNDLPAFHVAGVRIAVANAASEVKRTADYVTEKEGGGGAVREVCDLLLEARGQREACLQQYLESLKEPVSAISAVTEQAGQ